MIEFESWSRTRPFAALSIRSNNAEEAYGLWLAAQEED